MSQARHVELEIVSDLNEIGARDWDACAGGDKPDAHPVDPFSVHRFLLALESSGSVGPGTGWSPRHVVARLKKRVIAVMPMYLKAHSQGEYVFDHNWAHAFVQAGGQYYPKLQVAVPFTPATGRRFLTRPGFEETGQAALVEGAVRIASDNELSSLHVTYCTSAEAKAGQAMGLLHRTGQQFHWENRNYNDFTAFEADLSSRKRKAVRRERRKAADFGGRIHVLTGDDIQPVHWDAFWQFYQDTGARKWGTPYLTRAFFDLAHETMREDILLIMAEIDGRWVAGALNFIGADTLFGRYWGCIDNHAFMHFELCYYQAIEFAIANGLQRVEAGAQGEHKLSRGYMPVTTHSLHWIRDRGFRDAVARYLEAEKEAVDEEIDILAGYGPYRQKQETSDE